MKKTNFENLPSRNTPITAEALNSMQDDIEDAINGTEENISVSSKITANTNYTIPISYIVGANEIEIFWNGIYLAKDENWEEVGTEGQASTTVKFGWDIDVGEELLIRKRGAVNE